MYFQFLIEDESTKILVDHVMEKIKEKYTEEEIEWDKKFFKGIGHLRRIGNALGRKTGKLLNDLPMYMRAFDKKLQGMEQTALVVVLDNDKRDVDHFRKELENIAIGNMILCDYAFCIAVKEMEAWLLGDVEAIRAAYPRVKMQHMKKYEQDAICDTWEIRADMVYPQGVARLKKKAAGSYSVIGKAKCEWADKIGGYMSLHKNASPSYQYFIHELEKRIVKRKRGIL